MENSQLSLRILIDKNISTFLWVLLQKYDDTLQKAI